MIFSLTRFITILKLKFKICSSGFYMLIADAKFTLYQPYIYAFLQLQWYTTKITTTFCNLENIQEMAYGLIAQEFRLFPRAYFPVLFLFSFCVDARSFPFLQTK